MNFKEHKNRGVVAMMLVVLFAGVTLASVAGGFGAVSDLAERSRNSSRSKQTVLFADSVVEDVVYRTKTGKNVAAGEVYSQNGVSASLGSESGDGVVTYTVFGTTSDLVRNVAVSVSNLAPPTFIDAVTIGGGGILMNANSGIIGGAYTNGSIVGGSNTDITGDASAVGSISSPQPEVGGVSTENASPITLPQINEAYWMNAANSNNDPYEGNYVLNGSQAATLGPRRINGDLTLNSNTILTVTGPLYITGDLDVNSNSQIIVDESIADTGVVIVVDGTITFNSNAPAVAGLGDPPGYPVFVSTKSSGTAVLLNSNVEVEGMIYAQYADVVVNSNAAAVAVVAERLVLNSNAVIDFNGAIADRSYGGGVGGLLIEDWREVE